MAGIFSGLVGIFASLGINNAVQRFYFDIDTKDDERKDVVSSALWTLCLWSTIFCIICILISLPLKDYLFKKFQLPWYFVALSIASVVPNLILGFCNDVIRIHFKPAKFVILSLIKNIAGVAASIFILLYSNWGLSGLVWVGFLLPLVFVPLAIYFIKDDLLFRFKWEWAKKLYRFGYPFAFAGIAYWLFGGTDRWLLGEFSTIQQVGLFAIAFKLGTIVNFINSAFSQAWAPTIIKAQKDNPTTYKSDIVKIGEVYFNFILIVGIGICMFTKEFFMLTTPKEYWLAITPSIFVTIGLVISCSTQLSALGISMSKKTAILSRSAWVTALLNIGLNLVLIPFFAANGAALATALTYLCLTLCYFFYSHKLFPFPFNYSKIIGIFTIFVGLSLLTIFINRLDWYLAIAIKVTLLLLFFAFLIWLSWSDILPQLKKIKAKKTPN